MEKYQRHQQQYQQYLGLITAQDYTLPNEKQNINQL